MNLYLINNDNEIGNDNEICHDHIEGYVIAARNESEVRNLAASKSSTEGKKIWLGGRGKVTLIGIAASDITKPTIIMRSFNASWRNLY